MYKFIHKFIGTRPWAKACPKAPRCTFRLKKCMNSHYFGHDFLDCGQNPPSQGIIKNTMNFHVFGRGMRPLENDMFFHGLATGDSLPRESQKTSWISTFFARCSGRSKTTRFPRFGDRFLTKYLKMHPEHHGFPRFFIRNPPVREMHVFP